MISRTFFQEYLAQLTEDYRKTCDLSVDDMAYKLHISSRYYYDIKKKTHKHAISVTTFIFLLLTMPEETQLQTLRGLAEFVEKAQKDGTLPL